MKAEFPSIDQEKMVSPHAQEIEYALILQRLIASVKEDPSQLRQTIYEFARARLKIDTAWADDDEQKRLTSALETAILGVEDFSARREEKERLAYQSPPAQIASPSPASVERVHTLAAAPPQEILVPRTVYHYPDAPPLVEPLQRTAIWIVASFCVGMLCFAAVVGAAYYRQGLPLLREALGFQSPIAAIPTTDIPQGSISVATKTETGASSSVPFPLPSDYGVYALTNSRLSELSLLSTRVPDKRIAMSAPVSEPSLATLPDGKARFIIFRRDLVGSAPDRIDIRVVAQVARALTFDAKGRPNMSPVSDAWNIRNVAYEFRVRPIAGNPEMLLVQSEKADFTLPAGRYVLVLRDQGFDFTIAGQVTDLAHCLERTDAANGSFYSECLKF